MKGNPLDLHPHHMTEFYICHSPFNKGQILAKACTGPKRVYCPIANSMKRRGMPHSTTMMTYGIMKAPESEEQQEQWMAGSICTCICISSM